MFKIPKSKKYTFENEFSFLCLKKVRFVVKMDDEYLIKLSFF